MRRGALGGALALAAASVGLLSWSASTAEEAVRPEAPVEPWLAGAYARAAEAAYGARVLVVHARTPVTAEVFDAGRTPGGWGLYPGAPAGAEELSRALHALARRAAADWEDGRRLDEAPLVAALRLFGVQIVLLEDGARVFPPPGEPVAGLRREPAVPGLRVVGVEPVLRLADAAVTLPDAADPLGFARALAVEDARHLDLVPGTWGGSLVVEADRPGRFLFPWPAEGAIVTTGADEPRISRAGPLLVLELPAGETSVEVEYHRTELREVLVLLGTAALVAALLWLLVGLRPRAQEIAAAAADEDGE